MLKALDSKLAPELREIRSIEIKNASATRLASIIQQMMDARLERMRKVQPETAELERATIVADPRTNSLVVAAANDSFEVIKRLAADLDISTLGDASLVSVFPLAKGNIDRVAAAINQIMSRRYADMPPELRNSLRPLVLTDPRTSSLLVTANPEDLKSIEDLVNKLAATPENPAVGIHLISVGTNVRAELIAPRVQRLMADRLQSLGPAATPSDRVTIEADLAGNNLIVAANDENLAIVQSFVTELIEAELSGAGGGGGREVEMILCTGSMRAAEIIEMLQDLYIEEANRTRGPNTVRVRADERLNAVLVNAPGSDVRAIKSLIAQLDGAKPASIVEIKYVPLQSANALETVSLIENVLSGRGIGARRTTRQATVLKYLREIAKAQAIPEPPPAPAPAPGPGDDGAAATQPASLQVVDHDASEQVEMEVSAAIRESITLTPDLRTNTIIVSAPKESIKMIEQMIRDLDESNTGSKSIRIFKLTNADALAMAEIITDLFNLRQASNMYVLKPREDAALQSPAAADAPGAPSASAGIETGGISGTELTAVPDERQALSITVDSRTNSLIVSGTPTYLDLVSQVVEELDNLEANEREVYVYQLRNAVAADVAKVIGEFVDQEQRKLVSTLSVDQLGSAARLLEREITIQGDEKSNTVLVSASPRYMDRVKEMIRQLDVDPPQVLIQVMLAEVTLDSRDDWGVDMNFRAEIDGTDITGGFGFATAFVPGLGVPNLAITASDFDLLIRAIQSQGRLQVLSNPSIMAANNASARIQVGETLRLPSITTISDTGQVASAVEKEDIGVILEVTPSINPDGFVRMTIMPEISNLSARTTQISEDFESPIITRRTADTTVTVHDGQTIVIGGLISDRFEKRDRMVPFLGELPFIGPLFRSNSEETAKTELLIVLTPHVIESPTNFDRVDFITDREIDRLTVPPEVKESIRRGIIEGTGGLYDSKGNKIEVKTERQGEEGSETEKQE
jgi:type II secretion system protein D